MRIATCSLPLLLIATAAWGAGTAAAADWGVSFSAGSRGHHAGVHYRHGSYRSTPHRSAHRRVVTRHYTTRHYRSARDCGTRYYRSNHYVAPRVTNYRRNVVRRSHAPRTTVIRRAPAQRQVYVVRKQPVNVCYRRTTTYHAPARTRCYPTTYYRAARDCDIVYGKHRGNTRYVRGGRYDWGVSKRHGYQRYSSRTYIPQRYDGSRIRVNFYYDD